MVYLLDGCGNEISQHSTMAQAKLAVERLIPMGKDVKWLRLESGLSGSIDGTVWFRLVEER